jgi:hypothetical protein
MGEIAPRFSGRAGRVGLTLYRLYLGSIAVPRAPRAAARGARANRALVRRPPEARHFQLLFHSRVGRPVVRRAGAERRVRRRSKYSNKKGPPAIYLKSVSSTTP